MELLIILNLVVCFLAIIVVYIKYFFKSDEVRFRSHNTQLLLFFSYMLFIILLLFWNFNPNEYNNLDFLSLFSLIQMINVLFLIIVFYKIINLSKFKYLILFIVIIFLVSFFSLNNFFVIVSLFSHLSFLILSFLLMDRSSFRNSSLFGILYSCISILLFLLTYLSFVHEMIYSLLSNIMFFLFIFVFYKSLPLHKAQDKKSDNNENNIFLFVKYFIFIIIIINIILLSTLVIHEFGHVIVSKINGCDYRTIFFEGNNSPYTEVLCSDEKYRDFSILGGVLLPLFLSALLFFTGGKLSKSVALFMAGFGLVISSRDYVDLGFSKGLILSQIYIGFIILIVGLFLLARNKFDEHNLL